MEERLRYLAVGPFGERRWSFDFETKKLTDIHDFPGVKSIFITDKYICVKYQLNGYTYFVYEKGGSVVANGSSLD